MQATSVQWHITLPCHHPHQCVSQHYCDWRWAVTRARWDLGLCITSPLLCTTARAFGAHTVVDHGPSVFVTCTTHVTRYFLSTEMETFCGLFIRRVWSCPLCPPLCFVPKSVNSRQMLTEGKLNARPQGPPVVLATMNWLNQYELDSLRLWEVIAYSAQCYCLPLRKTSGNLREPLSTTHHRPQNLTTVSVVGSGESVHDVYYYVQNSIIWTTICCVMGNTTIWTFQASFCHTHSSGHTVSVDLGYLI